MDPVTIMAILNGAISAIEALAPKIKEMFQSGQITVEQQQDLMRRLDALRTQDYSGPEWKVEDSKPA